MHFEKKVGGLILNKLCAQAIVIGGIGYLQESNFQERITLMNRLLHQILSTFKTVTNFAYFVLTL